MSPHAPIFFFLVLLPLLINYPSHKIGYSSRLGSRLQLSRPLPLTRLLKSTLRPCFSFSSLHSFSHSHPLSSSTPRSPVIRSLVAPANLEISSSRNNFTAPFFLTKTIAITILHDLSCWSKEILISLNLSKPNLQIKYCLSSPSYFLH